MKKMSLRDETKTDFAFFAYSDSKGIFMRAERSEENEKEKTFSQIRFPGAYACITEDGTIKVDPKNVNQIQEEANKVDDRREEVSKKLKIVFFAIWFICFISMIPASFVHEYLTFVMCAIALISLGLSYIPTMVYIIAKRIMRDKDYIQLSKFHAAEHAAVNAYYDLNRVPTMEEIKKYSSFSYDCSTPRVVKKGWPFIVIGICRFIPGMWVFPAILLVILLSHLALKKNLFFTEVITLGKPTDYEYDAAIQAMTKALEKKKESEQMLEMLEQIILEDIGNCSGIIDIDMDKYKTMLMVQFEGNLMENS